MAATKTIMGSGTKAFRSLSIPRRRGLEIHGGPVVLLTGFGPFPGVPRNASAELVRELARKAARQHPEFRFVTEVLPVSWPVAPSKLQDTLSKIRPAMALHFGVSARASEFVIETLAYNSAGDVADQYGDRAIQEVLITGDRAQRLVTLPVQRMLQALHAGGFPAKISNDPGRYLCNAILYHSLRHGARALSRRTTGFIHVPATLEPGSLGKESKIGWDDAVSGGLALMEPCLAPLRSRAPALS